MSRSIRRCLVPVAAATLAAACSDSSTSPDGDLVGTHVLVSVNGLALPAVLPTNEGEIEVGSGQFTFTATGECEAAVQIDAPGGGAAETVGSTCTWTRTGPVVRITWADQSEDLASLEGGQLTVVATGLGGMVFVFGK